MEKPIIFSTPMVKAILGGLKTMTRRVIKPQPTFIEQSSRWVWSIPKSKVHKCCCTEVYTASREWWEYLLPDQFPFQPGDTLWVRETWCKTIEIEPNESLIHYHYKATPDNAMQCVSNPDKFFNWKPSIYMPRAAARLFLKVTNVRVERLQEITENDCYAEGTNCWDDACYVNNGWSPSFNDPDSGGCCIIKDGFKKLWNSTIKKQDLDTYGWNANPWVWVIEFEKVRS